MHNSSTLYVFDVDGLVTYPEFAREIIEPLNTRGCDILFMSHADNFMADKALIENGLREYVYGGVIYREMLGQFYEDMQSAMSSRHWWSKKKAYSKVEKALSDLGARSDADNVTHVLNMGKHWLALCEHFKVYVKCPWVFGYKNCLLVESDGVHWDYDYPNRLSGDMYIYYPNKISADLFRYSLLYTPEYPGIWQGYNPEMTPQQMRSVMRDTILNWKGEHFTSELGIEKGLYSEISRAHPERR